MAYSEEFRARVLEKFKQGEKWDSVVGWFKISRSTLSKWVKMAEKGRITDAPRKEYKTRKVDKEVLLKLVKEHPDWTLSQYAQIFNSVPQAIANRFKKLGITRKKKTLRYQERDEEKRRAYQRELKKIARSVVYVDESGIAETIFREYVWSKRGETVVSDIKGKKIRRVNVIAGLSNKKLLASLVFNSYINADCFNYWLEHHLLKELPTGTTIILDNASFHKSTKTKELVKNAHCHLLFLPPYSPDLNPIENFWAKMKRKIRSILPDVRDFDQAVDFAIL